MNRYPMMGTAAHIAKVVTATLMSLALLQGPCAGANGWRRVIVKSRADYEMGEPSGEGMQYPNSMVRSYSNPDYVYWAHDCGQGWRSTDGGQTWKRFLAKGLGASFGQSIEVDPADPNTVMITVDNLWCTSASPYQGLYKSTDAGDNWKLVLQIDYAEGHRWYKHNIAYSLTSIAGGEAKIWYVAFAGKRLYKSTDGGDDWALVTGLDSHAAIYALYVNPSNSDILYLGSNRGLYGSDDGGMTLNPLGNLPVGEVTTIQLAYSEPSEMYVVVKGSGLHKSVDGGISFSLLKGANKAIGCSINQHDPRIIYLLKEPDWGTSASSIEVSQDGGLTWNDIVSHPRPGLERDSGFGSSFRVAGGLGAIVPHPTKIGEAVGYAQAYLWRTTNCIDWHHSNDYFTGYTWTCRNSVLFDSNKPARFGFFAADMGVFISENSGKYFELLKTPLTILTDYGYTGNSNDLKAGAFQPETNAIVAAGGRIWGRGRMGIVWSPNDSGPWRTTSVDGSLWDVSSNLYGAYRNYFFNPDDPNILFVSDLRSNDGGKAFTLIGDLAHNDLEVYGMCRSDHNVLYAMNDVGTVIYRSTDGGDSWFEYVRKSWYAYASGVAISTELVFAIDPLVCNEIYTLYQNGDLARFNGNNWRPLGLLPYIRSLPDNSDLVRLHGHQAYPGISAVAVDPHYNSIIYAAVAHPGVSPIYRSIDRGNTWQDISYNLPRAGYQAALSISPHSGEILVGGSSGTWVFPPPYDHNTPVYSNATTAIGESNNPPVLKHPGNKDVYAGAILTFTVSATDPDADALFYWTSELPTGATFDYATNSFTWRPSGIHVGNHSITFSVTDGIETVAETMSITVGSIVDVPADANSIQSAINMAHDGGRIIVQPGCYPENINFNGKRITVTGTNPDDPDLVAATIINGSSDGSVVTFSSNEGPQSTLAGFTLTGGDAPMGGGIHIDSASPTIEKNIITGNTATLRGAAIYCADDHAIIRQNRIVANDSPYGLSALYFLRSSATLQNNLIVENTAYQGAALLWWLGQPTLLNNTIAYNTSTFNAFTCMLAMGAGSTAPVIRNNVIAFNNGGPGLYGVGFLDPDEVVYNNLFANSPTNYFGTFPDLCGMSGNLSMDPLFWDAASGNYHLASEPGRWDEASQTWLTDTQTSGCIDAGDPTDTHAQELWPHGQRINLGAYGGLAEASMSLSYAGSQADINQDGHTDIVDVLALVENWLTRKSLLASDLNRDGLVNLDDFHIIVRKQSSN